MIVVGAMILFGVLTYMSCNGDLSSSSSSSSSGSSRKVTCGYCGKSYSITSSNGKNISRTRLCNSCYSFYKGAQDALGN